MFGNCCTPTQREITLNSIPQNMQPCSCRKQFMRKCQLHIRHGKMRHSWVATLRPRKTTDSLHSYIYICVQRGQYHILQILQVNACYNTAHLEYSNSCNAACLSGFKDKSRVTIHQRGAKCISAWSPSVNHCSVPLP